MARLRSNNVFGTITNNPLAIGGATLNSAGLANLVAVAGADRAAITLDPNRVNGAPEIVWVTAHTGAATSATILRAQEGTSAREHPSGTFWVHGWTALDAGLGVLGYAQVVANQGSITGTAVDLTGLSSAVTVGVSRRVRISAQIAVQSTVHDDNVRLDILEGAAFQNLGQLQITTSQNILRCAAVITPSAGAHTYKLQLSRTTGTGTITMAAGASNPAFILVEDIGAA